MKRKIFAILLLSTLIVNFYTPTSTEAIEALPRITNVQINDFNVKFSY